MTTEDGPPQSARSDDDRLADSPAAIRGYHQGATDPTGTRVSAEPSAGAEPAEPPQPPPTAPPRRTNRVASRRRVKSGHKRSFLRELPGIVITALVISVLIKTFLVQAFYIPSGSMENTLLVNDRVLVNKLADKPDEIHRGDVVVFKDPGGWLDQSEQAGDGGIRGAVRDALVFVGLAPAQGEEDLIKRVIGIGGDHVVGRNGHVYVNGVLLREQSYLFPGDDSNDERNFDVRVPQGMLWVMGDHRSVSQDSRSHHTPADPRSGMVPVSDVIGRAFTIVWPLDRAQILHRPAQFESPRLSGSGG